jgi:hypothetical protein
MNESMPPYAALQHELQALVPKLGFSQRCKAVFRYFSTYKNSLLSQGSVDSRNAAMMRCRI